MIAQIDDFNQQKANKKASKKSKWPKNILGWVQHGVANLFAAQRKRKKDNLALRQLMQLDDALLKDIGLTRHDLMAVEHGSSTIDSIVKQKILSNQDNMYISTSLRK